MHELSIVANLFEILEKKAKEKKAKKIVSLKLQIGQLSGIIPELFRSAYDIYKKDTIASEASLNIEIVPFRVECQKCKTKMSKDDFILTCDQCGSHDLKILSGTELLLEKIELET
jgi:hydrogenase nickel incorporation protein HypA/HybF